MKQKLLATLLALFAIATTARAQSNETWSVRLDDFGSNKTNVIKVVSDELGLGLKAAKDLVDSAPCTLVENVTEAQAEDLAQKLRNAGATVTVQNNNGTAPSSGKWSVRLDDAGSNKTNVIRVVREELGVTLAEAKDLVDSAPCTLVENVTEAQAEAFAQKLRNAGATVTVYINGIEINATNFPDANFRNWLLAQAYGTDGYLTSEEIAAVTSISVSGKSIADLTGIEHFPALTTLECYDNQLTSLDVSKNTALTYLSCFRNQLTELNVSAANTELYYLSCFDNQIKGEKMLALVNSLPTVTSGTFCAIDTWSSNEQNVITKPQVAIATGKGWRVADSNGGGDYAGIDDPTCIEINETNFPNANFRKWLLAQTYGADGYLTPEEIAAVTSIDVSGKSITNLTGIEHFIALTYLDCSGNDLHSLDVSQNTALTYLDCSRTHLDSLDVSQNTALTYLDCSNIYYFLTELDLSQNTALTTLKCSVNHYLTSLDVSKNTALTELDCSNTPLTELDLSQNTALTTLKCNGNKLTSLDVSKNTALTYLDCTGPGTGGGGRCNQLTSLDLSQNTALTTLKCSDNLLTSLDLSNHNYLSSTILSQKMTVKAVKLADGRMGIDLGVEGIDKSRVLELKGDNKNVEVVISGQYLVIADNVYDCPGRVTYQFDT